MIEVTCPKCTKAFRCEKPTEETNYTVNCPYCGTRCRINLAQTDTSVQPNKKSFIGSSKRNLFLLIISATIVIVVAVIICTGIMTRNKKTPIATEVEATERPSSASVIAESTPKPTVETVSGTIGDYIVTIKNTKITKNKYDGADIIIVTYAFTNNSDKSASFSWAIDDTLFQNGVEIPSIYSNWGLQNEYNVDNAGKEIKPGVTLDIDCAYELNDTKTNIDVEIKEIFSWSDEVLNYTIEL